MDSTYTDTQGARGACGDTRSRAPLEQALALMLASRSGAMALIEGVLEHEPECASAHRLRAALYVLGSDDRPREELERSVEAIELRGTGASDRDRRHAAAARAWLEARPELALARYGEILIDDPRDSLALLVAHALDFRLGRRDMLRDRPAEVLPHWHAGVPGYGYVLGMYAFGLEETGDYAGAEATARRALELAPDNAAAVHVVAHVMEMQGRPREGIEWLDAMRAAWEDTGFAVHLAWHRALFHLDLDETGEALAIYDTRINPEDESSTSDLVDASALLWRLQLRGVAVGSRWRALAACWKDKRLAGARAFNLTHATMAFAAAGHADEATRLIAYLEWDCATHSVNTTDDLLIAQPVCEGLVSFAQADYARAVERLDLVRHLATRCGGSVAQCDLIHLTLVEAALRSRRGRLAHALAAERSARKPSSRLNSVLIARAREALTSSGIAGVPELARA